MGKKKWIGAAIMENSMEASQKKKKKRKKTTIWPSNSTPTYISEKNKNTGSKRCMRLSVQSSIVYNCQHMEAT